MVLQTYYLFHLPSYTNFIWFIFFGSLCSYNFHWYLTPGLYGGTYRTNWSIKNKKLHLFLFIIGLVGCTWFCIQLIFYWKWLMATAFITFLYSAPKIPYLPFNYLRKIAVGKTIFLSLVWTHTTTILPLLISRIHWETSHFIFAVNRFFFIYAICILFDYRDREEDKKEGIKSMITILSEKNIDRLFYFSVFIFFVTTLALYLSGFGFTNCIALLIPGIIISFIYQYAKRITTDYFYYFFLDGLMMFSSVLIFLFQI
jgi:4-hydroxybenzoate polyprenyltransferase